jgi:hypothetical protein
MTVVVTPGGGTSDALLAKCASIRRRRTDSAWSTLAPVAEQPGMSGQKTRTPWPGFEDWM